MARFVMNVMMASGGYPWTIVRATRRKEYLDALEAASAEQNILPFARFIREEMSVDWSQERARKQPHPCRWQKPHPGRKCWVPETVP
jgi:hypothetical protein